MLLDQCFRKLLLNLNQTWLSGAQGWPGYWLDKPELAACTHTGARREAELERAQQRLQPPAILAARSAQLAQFTPGAAPGGDLDFDNPAKGTAGTVLPDPEYKMVQRRELISLLCRNPPC